MFLIKMVQKASERHIRGRYRDVTTLGVWWAVGTESGVLPARSGFSGAKATPKPGLANPSFRGEAGERPQSPPRLLWVLAQATPTVKLDFYPHSLPSHT